MVKSHEIPDKSLDIQQELSRKLKAQEDRHSRIEELLQTKIKRLQEIMDNTREAVVTVNRKFIINYASPGCKALTGREKKDLIGRMLQDFVHPEDIEQFSLNIKDAVKNGTRNIMECRYRHMDGHYLWLEISCKAQYDSKGRLKGLYFTGRDISKRKSTEEVLQESQKNLVEKVDYLNTLIENMNEMFFTYDKESRLTLVNRKVTRILGYEQEEMIGRNLLDFIPEQQREEVRRRIKGRLEQGITESYETMIVDKKGDCRYVLFDTAPIKQMGEIIGGMLVAEDITERKLAEKAFRESEQRLSSIINFLPDPTFAVDTEGRVITWNRAMEELSGVKAEEILGKSGYEHAISFYGIRRPMLLDMVFNQNGMVENSYELFERTNDSLYAENYTLMQGPGGKKTRTYIWGKASPLYDAEGKVIGSIETIRDILQRKQNEEHLRFLSLHDRLTLVYNRTFFEEEMRRLGDGQNPVGMLICDVDGLKFINDTMGHDRGDSLLVAVSEVIKRCLRKEDVVARIGGDEFAILIPNATGSGVKETYQRLMDEINRYNEKNRDLPLSISIGYAVRSSNRESMDELFKEADNNMYQEKLHRNSSVRSALVNALMKTLEARDFITEGHAERMQVLIARLAEALNLADHTINHLRLLARFHDIGKVGIPDRILFKPGPLNFEERNEMQRHSKIGYRIALSAPDLVPISDSILNHHEWWNGEGYPQGLKGEEIPLVCRILAVVDAYDAMTNDRPYRRAMPHQEAIEELQRCAGIQFDPLIVIEFVKLFL